MENIFEKLNKDKMNFNIYFAGDDSCYLDVKYDKQPIDLLGDYLDTVHYFMASCINKKGNKVGQVDFDIMDNKAVSLGEIRVDRRYRHKGYGSKLLRFVDLIARDSDLGKIEGMFSPDDFDKGLIFYARNGYDYVNDNGGNYIHKTVDKTQDFSDLIIDFPENRIDFEVDKEVNI